MESIMKKIILAIILTFSSSAFSYEIGGAYAQLLNCEFGQHGYEYGYVGTYEVNGKIFKVFFGSNYCEY